MRNTTIKFDLAFICQLPIIQVTKSPTLSISRLSISRIAADWQVKYTLCSRSKFIEGNSWQTLHLVPTHLNCWQMRGDIIDNLFLISTGKYVIDRSSDRLCTWLLRGSRSHSLLTPGNGTLDVDLAEPVHTRYLAKVKVTFYFNVVLFDVREYIRKSAVLLNIGTELDDIVAPCSWFRDQELVWSSYEPTLPRYHAMYTST